MLSSYSGDNSEEAKAKVQKLQLELKDAEDELAETEMDKLLDDTSALLDSLFLEAETILNQRLDNIDYLLEQVVESINIAAGADSNIASALSSEGAIAIAVSDNASSIKDTLASEAKNVGTSLSAAMNNIWSTGDGNAKSVLTTYGEDFKAKSATIITTLNGIKSSVGTMVSSLNKEAEKKDPTKNSNSNNNKNNNKQNNVSSNQRTDKEHYGVALAVWNGSYGWGNGDARKKRLKEKGFDVSKVQSIVNRMGREGYVHTAAWIKKYYGITDKDLKKYSLNSYAVGKQNFISDEVAWTQENGREFIVRPSDGAILTPVAKGDSVLNAQASGNIWDMANSPAEFIKDNLKLNAANVPNNSSTQSVYHQTIENVTFDFKNVKNYEEMLHALKDDKRFEKLVTAMTIDRIAGKSSLAKGKSIR